MKLAGAPISWGVCEVPDWGLQLPAERVLEEMRSVGLTATEAGPPGFLPTDPAAVRALLEPRGLRMIGGFVTAVLHDASRRGEELASVDRQAAWLAASGGEALVLAAASDQQGYSKAAEIDEAGWSALFSALDEVERIARRHSLALAVHPHYGTAIETAAQVDRFLDGCAHGLCLDTGHVALGGADPVDVARRAGARVRHVHLKDVDADLGPRVRSRALDYNDGVRQGLYRRLGAGTARIADVLAHLRSSGYDGWYVLEQDVMLDRVPEHAPEDVLRSADFVRRHV